MNSQLIGLYLKNSWTTCVQSPSWSFAACCVAIIFGVALGPLFLSFTLLWWLWMLGGSIFLVLIIRKRKVRLFLLLIFLVLTGVFRYSEALLPPSVETIADAAGGASRFSGQVSAEVDRRIDRQYLVLDELSVVDHSVDGKLLLSLPLYPEVAYGDTLVFNGRVTVPEPFEGFAYDKYLLSKGILAVCWQPEDIDIIKGDADDFIARTLAIKRVLVEELRSIVPEPQAAFLTGLLFGGNSALSSELKEDFARTGVSHVLAASGFNVSLFSLFLLGWLLQTPLGRKRGLVVIAFLLLLYTVMAGATPAVVRAVVMASWLLIAKWVNRQASMRNVILLSCALMLLINPLLLFWDVGFQLSFVATIALFVLAPLLEPYFKFVPKTIGVRAAFVGSIAAIILTLPLILWHFGAVSIVAPLVNLLILPLIPYLMALILIALAFALVSTGAGMIVALPSWGIASALLYCVTWFSDLPFASQEVLRSRGLALTALLGVFLFVWALKRVRNN
jgi:competence protein ComEC